MHPLCRAAVVIPAHNEERTIVACLESIAVAVSRLATPEQVEVVVVDNASRDSTAEAARSFAGSIPALHIISETSKGIGLARAGGARFALSRAATRAQEAAADFWLITADADVVVPEHWLVNWFDAFARSDALMIAGSGTFEQDFYDRYPIAAQIFRRSHQKLRGIEQWVGVINVDGYNSAIERRCYAATGPYKQPRRVLPDGMTVNLAGEDWDLSTRAVGLGFRVIRSVHEPVTVSARRFEKAPTDFIDGTAYEQPFDKVDGYTAAPDIPAEDLEAYYAIGALRTTLHFVAKPLLVNPALLDRAEIAERLGSDLVGEIRAWIGDHKAPDLFREGDQFIAQYLFAFHEAFGSRLAPRFFGDPQ